MPLVIPTNTSSLETQKNLNRSQMALGKSFARLSSGFRVNSAADDAAGLAVSESMKSQIRSYAVAERNAGDAISMTQTAEGALGEVHDIMGRLRELAMQSSNGSLTNTDRGYLNTEFSALKAEVTRIQGSAKFNGVSLLNATAASVKFQVGLNNATVDQISVTFGGVALTTLLAATTSVSTATAALISLGRIDTSIGSISGYRAKYGAAMNRLDVTVSTIQTMRVNLAAANSRIRDVDVAEETSQLARNQVLAQAGVSVLSQANQLPQLAMALLQG